MIDREFARRIAAEHLEEGCPNPSGVTPVILDSKTIERDFGWVFFYESKEYLDTREIGARMLGNAPIIVDRRDGSVHVTGSAMPVERYIAEYERRRSSPSAARSKG